VPRRFPFASLAVAASLLTAPALAQRAPARLASGGLEAALGEPALRIEPATSYGAPPASRRAAWDRFLRAAGASSRPEAWQALWDRDTRSPLRIFGAGIPAPGTVADAAVAAAHARAFVAAHRDLLAPGASIDDLQLVANDLDAGLRTVAFTQHARVVGGGLVPVIGGRVGFRYKNDRLIVIAAETFAAPRLPAPQIASDAAVLAASAWIAEQHASASLREPPDFVALPLVRAGGVNLRLAHRVVLDAAAPRARWAVYVDARSGAPLAREQLLRFDTASIIFDTPVRAPQLGRTTFPAERLDIQVDGAPVETGDGGVFSWTSTGMPASVLVDAVGSLVDVNNDAGLGATALFSGTDGAQVLWSLADDELGDAQLTTFIHANLIKAHARTIAPAMTFLDAQLPVRPNIEDAAGCNAFWDGDALNFYRQTGNCNNTARLPDVVYHEFGHGFHQHSVIAGAGALDGALGEAAGDTMAASKTHDPRIAPGFYLMGDTELRRLDELHHWPEDISGDPHETGLIWGGAMWDLRAYLTADLGQDQGDAVTNKLYYQALRRSSNIPTTYAEILAADDDDGDLSNGTPHICAINRAFSRHGLSPWLDAAGTTLVHEPLTVVPYSKEPHPLEVTTKQAYPQCMATAKIDSVDLSFHLVGGGLGTASLTQDGDAWKGSLPATADGSALRYTLMASVDGYGRELPDNPADDEYRVFVGDVVPIYCNDFETQIDGWTFADDKGGSGDFEWGTPQGAAGDPTAAFSGQKVLGDHLGGDGTYKPFHTVSATSPVIDVGQERNVRLQFRRWLTVKDGIYDQASVIVNGQVMWQNASTDSSDGTLDHRDAEWRFEDIDLSSLVKPGATTVQVRFELASHKSHPLGGWNVDDLCVVAWHQAAPPSAADAGADAAPDGGDGAATPASGCSCELPASPDGARAPIAATLLALAGVASLRRRRRATARPT
jgi:hypothetical protein